MGNLLSLNIKKIMTVFLLLLRKFTKALYKFRGGQRFAEFIRKSFLRYGQKILIEDFDESLKFFCELDEHMGSQIFWRGSYSGDQLIVLNKLLRPDSVFVDVGASHGEFTLFAAKRAVKGMVISFEPVKDSFEKLGKNIEINKFDKVKTYNFGLGKESKTLPIYTKGAKFTDGSVHRGLHTTCKMKERDKYIGDISIHPLDSFIESEEIGTIDIMKVDVEGAELSALQGSEVAIRKFKPIIFIEVAEETCAAMGYSGRELLDFISKFGYSFEIIGENGITMPLKNINEIGVFQNIVCFPKK